MPKEKSPQTRALEDVKRRFAFHPATETTGPQHDAVRADLGRLAAKMVKTLPDGREKSLVLTHLEEAMFWGNAAIARHGESSDAPAPQREQGTDVTEPPAAKRRAAAVKAGAPAAKTARRVTRRAQS